MLGPSAGVTRRGEEVPVLCNILCDTGTVLGTGQVEPSVAVFLTAHDGGPSLPTDAAVLERAKQPHQRQPRGLARQSRDSGQGAGLWPLLGLSPQTRLEEEAPVPEALWSRWEPDFCPTAGGEGRPFFRGVWAKLWQTSPGTNLPALVRLSPSEPLG